MVSAASEASRRRGCITVSDLPHLLLVALGDWKERRLEADRDGLIEVLILERRHVEVGVAPIGARVRKEVTQGDGRETSPGSASIDTGGDESNTLNVRLAKPLVPVVASDSKQGSTILRPEPSVGDVGAPAREPPADSTTLDVIPGHGLARILGVVLPTALASRVYRC